LLRNKRKHRKNTNKIFSLYVVFSQTRNAKSCDVLLLVVSILPAIFWQQQMVSNKYYFYYRVSIIAKRKLFFCDSSYIISYLQTRSVIDGHLSSTGHPCCAVLTLMFYVIVTWLRPVAYLCKLVQRVSLNMCSIQ